MYSKFNMNIIFEGYVSCVMFPVLCVLLYISYWINIMCLTYIPRHFALKCLYQRRRLREHVYWLSPFLMVLYFAFFISLVSRTPSGGKLVLIIYGAQNLDFEYTHLIF
jgi:hypothetical protein